MSNNRSTILPILNVILAGIKDSLSYHKTIPLLANSQPIWQITISLVAANVVVYIGGSLIYTHGSLLHVLYFYEFFIMNYTVLFKLGIAHIVSFLSGNMSFSSLYAKTLIKTLYHANWLIPISCLCYISNLSSYQSLSDYIYKYINNLPKDHVIPKVHQKEISHSAYGFIVWFVCYIQMQLLLTIVPVTISYIASCFVLQPSTITNTPGLPNITVMYLIFQTFSLFSKLIGIFISCILFSMYGFEPFWYVKYMYIRISYTFLVFCILITEYAYP